MIIIAKYFYLVIVLLGVIFVATKFIQKEKGVAMFSIITLPLILIIAKISGIIYYDPRPFVVRHFIPLVAHAADNGFPSDHALLSFAIASVIFVYNKKIGLILFLAGFLVGISRIYVGIHSIIDIMGSFVISVAVTYLVYLVLKKYPLVPIEK